LKKNFVYALIFGISLLWGFSFIALNVLMRWLDPLQIIAVRWTIAACIFIGMMLAGKFRIDIGKKNFKFLLLAGMIEPGMYSVFEVYGLYYTSPSVSSIFIATIPCMSLILGFLFFRMPATRMGVISIFVAFAGVGVCTCFAPGFSAGGNLKGYSLMMCAVVAGALFSFVSAKASRDYSAVEITSAMAIVGSVGFNTVNIFRGNFFRSYSAIFVHWEVAVGILFLAVFCSALCYIGLNKVLAVLNPAIANNMIGSSITIIGVIAGVVINGDSAGVYTVIGVSLTVIGVWLSSKGIEELEQGESG